jgi:hypothetical protein
MSMSEFFNYDKSSHVVETPPGDAASKPDATLLDGEQKPELNPMGAPQQNVKPGFIESTPQAVREARATAEHNPYLATQLDEAGKHVEALADGSDADPLDKDAVALHQANVRELSTIVLTDFGGSPNDAQLLSSEVARYQKLSPEEQAAEQNSSLDLLKRNRPETWQSDLKLARAFVARDARVFNFLRDSGLGNSYAITTRIIELARASAVRGGPKK